MLTEPLGGWRKVSVRATKTARDLAEEVRELLDVDYPEADKVVLVWDTMNTHTPASFYKAFAPAEARRLLERLESHYTPKHGSWLDMAEIELSVFTKQCLNRRIADIETLRREASAWAERRNAAQVGLDWQFTTDDAGTKLKATVPANCGEMSYWCPPASSPRAPGKRPQRAPLSAATRRSKEHPLVDGTAPPRIVAHPSASKR